MDLCVVENCSVHPAALLAGLHADDCGRCEAEGHAKVERGQGGDQRHQNCDFVAAGDDLAAAGGDGVEQAGVRSVHGQIAFCPPQRRGALLAHDESDAVRRYGRVRLAVRWPDLGRPQPSRRSPRDRGAASQRPHPPGHRQRLCVVVGHHGLRILVVGDRLVGRRFAARARSSFWRACAGGLTMADIRPLPEASAGPPLKSRTPAACRCVVACDGAGRGGQRRGDRPDADARHVRGHRDAQPATGQPLHRRVRQSLTLRCERTLRTRHAQPARDGACPCDRAT